jgi:hypothetical protein
MTALVIISLTYPATPPLQGERIEIFTLLRVVQYLKHNQYRSHQQVE